MPCVVTDVPTSGEVSPVPWISAAWVYGEPHPDPTVAAGMAAAPSAASYAPPSPVPATVAAPPAGDYNPFGA
jgi:hypothetical protein